MLWDNSAMSLIKADLDVQWCSLITTSAVQVSHHLHAWSILFCLVLKPHPHMLPACCTFVAGCMLKLRDSPEQAQGGARGPPP